MGAPKGNKNALQHGFYAQHLTPDEQARIEMVEEDLTEEIKMLRVFFDRLSGQLRGRTDYDEDGREKLRLIATISIAIGTLTSRRAYLTGRGSGTEEAIEAAVLAVTPLWGKA
jgi:hypothetical protein